MFFNPNPPICNGLLQMTQPQYALRNVLKLLLHIFCEKGVKQKKVT